MTPEEVTFTTTFKSSKSWTRKQITIDKEHFQAIDHIKKECKKLGLTFIFSEQLKPLIGSFLKLFCEQYQIDLNGIQIPLGDYYEIEKKQTNNEE